MATEAASEAVGTRRARRPAPRPPREAGPLTDPRPHALDPAVHLQSTTESDVSPDSSLRELAAEAVGLLRVRMRRRRAVRPRRLDAPHRRRRRRRLECLALLALTAVVSLTTAWAVWHTAADYRLRLGESARPERDVLEVSLEETKRNHRLEVAPGASNGRSPHAREGQPGTARGATDVGARSAGRKDQALEVSGPVLGGAAAGTTLVVGWLAGRWVLRRFPDDDVIQQDPNPRKQPPPAQDGEQPVLEDAPDRAEDMPVDVPEAEYERHEEGRPSGDDAVADAPSGQAAPEEAPRAAPAPPVPPQVRAFEPPAYVTRERLYEARKAPRVAVELEGELRWLGERWPITLTALSSEDLTFQASTRPSVPGRRAPLTGGDHVRVVFPGVTGPVETSGQLAWQRAGAGGFAAGVCFATLPAAELERVMAVCAAHGA